MKVLIKSNKGNNSIPSIQNTFNEQMTILYIRMENRSRTCHIQKGRFLFTI